MAVWLGIRTLGCCLGCNVFVGRLLDSPLSLLLLLLVLFAFLLRLQNVVHQVIDVLIIHLLVCVVKLLVLGLELFALTFVAATLRLVSSLALRRPVEVVHRTILRRAATHAPATLSRPLVVLEFSAIAELILTRRVCTLGPFTGLGLSHLILLLPLQLLLLLNELGASVLVEIKVEGLTAIEVFVGLRNRVFVALNLFDLVKVLFQGLARMGSAVPPRRFLDDGRDGLVFDYGAHVDRVVHAAEDAVLVRVRHVDVAQQLQPQGFELVRVVLEQVEVVAHSRQDFVEVFLRFAPILLHLQLLRHLRSVRLFTRTLICVLRGLHNWVAWHDWDFDLLDQVIFFRVFLQFVAHGADNILDLGLEEVLERVDIDGERLTIHFLNLFLLVQNRDNLRVVVPILFRPLPVVQVNQHVGQVLVQSVFNRVGVLLGLGSLLGVALGMLLILLLLRCLLGALRLGRTVVLLVIVVLVLSLASIALALIVLLTAFSGLLESWGLSGLRRLSLVDSLSSRLAVLRVVGSLGLLSPLMLVLDLVAKVVFVTLFWAINALLLRVFVFALLLTFLIVSIHANVFSA